MTGPAAARARSPYPAALAIALGFVLLGLHVESSPRWRNLRDGFRSQAVPAPLLDRGTLGDVLRRENLVRLRPASTAAPAPREEAPPFALRAAAGDALYEANPRRLPPELDARLPASVDLPADLPVVSVAIRPVDLEDPERGLLARPRERLERRVDAAFYRGGRLVLRTGAGLRLQGDSTRDPAHPLNRGTDRRSWRLVFRSRYGLDAIPGRTVFDELDLPLRALVMRRNRAVFAHALALDVARRIGAETPATCVGLLYLNGENQGYVILNEHVSPRQWRFHRGGHEVYLFRRRSPPDRLSFHAHSPLLLWVEENAPRIPLAEAERFVDVDSLLAYVFTVAYCGTNDWEQAGLVLDADDPTDRWTFVPWDLDRSFLDPDLPPGTPPWRKSAFDLLLDDPREVRDSVAARLFAALLGDASFRRRLEAFVERSLRRLDREWIAERLAHYRRFLERSDGSVPRAFEKLRAFFEGREGFVRSDLRRVLDRAARGGW